ncbi:MAG: glycosyltransferase family 2 protein [Silicimonas sp.]|nr:glycosyltransferase family 2 protein [Silicimonas sp.]
MAVQKRQFAPVKIGPLDLLGAVRTDDHVVLAVPAGTSPDALHAALQLEDVAIRALGQSLLAYLPPRVECDAHRAELDHFRDKDVMVAFRNGETPEAAVDWMAYHAKEHGAEAALIFDRDPPEQADFADRLTALDPAEQVLVVSASHPLGLAEAPDARHTALAPAAPSRTMPPQDPWHAPLGQLAIYELLRHRFLSAARAVAFLDLADLLMPDVDGSVFDRVHVAPGQCLMLQGTEVYPWRLRRNKPAPHSDHIALRRGEQRWLSSWAAAPKAMPPEALWRPVRVAGTPAVDAAPVQFRRCMGVVFPGAPVNALVQKSDLVEDTTLLDQMARAFDASPLRLPQSITLPPRPDTDRVTIVTAMKNEGPFVLDWLAHNRAIGVDHHLVYTNDCSDGTERLLDLLSGAGVIRRDNPYRETGKVPQYAAFRAAEQESVVQSADWLLTLDVDEYINIHKGNGRISDLLEAVPDAHVISMPWRLFGNADRHRFEDRPVTELFPHAAPQYAPRPLQAWAFKTIYRNAGLFRRMGVHRPKGVDKAAQGQMRWVDGSGRGIPANTWRACWRVSKANWGYDMVSINHYAVRSAESFLVKRDRGRVNHTTRDQGEAYWFRMNHNAEEDRSIRRLDAARAAEMDRLLALPGVADAHRAAVDWHRDRIKTLLADPDHAALYASITSPRLENLSRMTTRFGARVHFLGPHLIPDEIAERDPKEDFFFTVE